MALPQLSNTLMSLEPALWLCAFIAYLRLKNQSRFPMFAGFLGVKLASSLVLTGIYRALPSTADMGHLHSYFYTYWISYFAGCIILFFALQELFRHVMASLPGLSELGIICFRWAALASLVIAFASIVTSLPLISQNTSVSFICTEIGCCLCVLELCLLAFLLVCIQTMKYTVRSRVFGLCLGLGMMAAMDMTLFALRYSAVHEILDQISAFVTLGALAVISAYLLMPEPVRKQAALPAASPLLRWNDLALALGHNAETATGQNGFLQDVEGVVDRVLAKNSMNTAS